MVFNEVFGVSTEENFSGTIRLKLFFQDTLDFLFSTKITNYLAIKE